MNLGPAGGDEHAFHAGQIAVDFLGDKGDIGMQELERAQQHVIKHFLRGLFALFIAAVEALLGKLDVPVAEVAPHKIIELGGSQAQLELLQVVGDFARGFLELGENPLVTQLQLIRRGHALGREAFQVHQHEARGVPNLVDEVAEGFDFFLGHAHVRARGDAHFQREAQRVRAVLVDDGDGVDAVAEGLRHLPPLRVAHQAVHQGHMEGAFSHLLDAGEHHAREPEEDDIVAAGEHAVGVEIAQIFRIVRPAEGRKRPQRRGEPGIEHVLVLMDATAALWAGGDVFAGNGDFAAVVAVESRDAVAPPELTGNAPVADVLHPVQIRLFKALGHEHELFVLRHFDGRLGQGLHLYKPLGRHQRLHVVMAAVAGADVVGKRLDLHQQAELFQLLHHGFAAGFAGHAREFAGVFVHGAVVVEHANDGQIVALGDLEVVGVVRRGHLHRAGAELQIGIVVGDDGNFAVHDRQGDGLAYHVLVALVGGVDAHAGIAQHGFRAGGGDDDIAVRAGIADVPEVGILLHILHFRVGKGSLAGGAPVDDARAAVNQALFIQAHKGFAHGAAEALVHGKALARPIAGNAQLAKLLDDAAAVFLFPGPGALQEAFAADVLLGDALGLERLDHLDFRGDGGMVGAGHPQGGVALHAMIANQHILRHFVQRVADVELAGDVRRRHDDGEGLLVRVDDRLEGPGRFPLFVDARFHILRRKYLVHLEFLHGFPSVRKIKRLSRPKGGDRPRYHLFYLCKEAS